MARPLQTAENNSVESLKPGIKPEYKWSELSEKGLVSQFKISAETPVALVKLQQRDQPEYWAGFHNFYVITRYNHSELYAMAVYQLATELAQATATTTTASAAP